MYLRKSILSEQSFQKSACKYGSKSFWRECSWCGSKLLGRPYQLCFLLTKLCNVRRREARSLWFCREFLWGKFPVNFIMRYLAFQRWWPCSLRTCQATLRGEDSFLHFWWIPLHDLPFRRKFRWGFFPFCSVRKLWGGEVLVFWFPQRFRWSWTW